MTTTKLTLNDALLVAIDIAKHRNEVLIEEPGRARRRRMSVLNTGLSTTGSSKRSASMDVLSSPASRRPVTTTGLWRIACWKPVSRCD